MVIVVIKPGTTAFQKHLARRFPRKFMYAEGRLEQTGEWLQRLNTEFKLKSPNRLRDLYYDDKTSIDHRAGEQRLFFGRKPATGRPSATDFLSEINTTEQLLAEIAAIKRRLNAHEEFERKLEKAFS